MQLETFNFQPDRGWSQQPLPALDSDHTLVIVFGLSTDETITAALAELVATYPKATLIGCSTAGEVYERQLLDDSLTVAVLKFVQTSLQVAVAAIDAVDGSFEAGREIAAGLLDEGLRGVFVLSDGLTVTGSELIRGLNEVLPEQVIVTGGLAADGDRFAQTRIMVNGEVGSGKACAVGFYGDAIRIGYGSKGGWDIFGIERKVTRSAGNTLYELDGQPALALYKKYLGDRAAGLPATGLLFPLSLRGSGQQESVVRTILSVDEEQQSITYAGTIPEGSMTRLMRANFDRLIDGACDAGTEAADAIAAQPPLLTIAISCIGRRLVLGERSEEEIEATLDMLPAGTRQIGFYSYGELSPLASGRCDLHNQTMTLTTIGEA
jgi:hypothetical protein